MIAKADLAAMPVTEGKGTPKGAQKAELQRNLFGSGTSIRPGVGNRGPKAASAHSAQWPGSSLIMVYHGSAGPLDLRFVSCVDCARTRSHTRHPTSMTEKRICH